MKDEFIEGHMNTQAVRINGSGFVYRNPLDGKVYESIGQKPLNWDEGYPPGIEPETPEAHDYDAMRAKFQSLPNYAMNREFIDQQIAKPEDSQYEDPLWIGASRILYHYMNHKPARKRHGRNSTTQAQDAKPLDSGHSYADWGVNFMLKFNYNLPYMMVQANKTRSMPVDVAKAMYYLMETSDRDGISASNTGMGIAHAAWDVTNWVGLATFGIGVAGKQAGKIATKEGVKAILKEIIMANPTKASVATGVEGAVFSAADNLAQQSVRINADQQDGINKKELTTASTIGAVLGEEITRVGAPLVRKGGEVLKKGLENAREKAQASKDKKEIDTIVDNEMGMVKDTSPPMDKDKSVGSGALRENVSFNEIDELGFYSQLLEAAKILPPKISTADAIQIIKKKGGVKEEELKWVGVDDFLKNQESKGNKSFDRQELVNFIRNNQVKLQVNERKGTVQEMERVSNPAEDIISYERFDSENPGYFSEEIDMLLENEEFGDYDAITRFIRNKLTGSETARGDPDEVKVGELINELKELRSRESDTEIYHGNVEGRSPELHGMLEEYMEDLVRIRYEDQPFSRVSVEGFNQDRNDGFYAIGNAEYGWTLYKDGEIVGRHGRHGQEYQINNPHDIIQVREAVSNNNFDEGYIDYPSIGEDGETRFSEYTLDGEDMQGDYEEITLTFANEKQITDKNMPTIRYNQIYTNSHFGDGEVVHYRSVGRDFTDIVNQPANVKSIEEIQSDWSQNARYGKGLLNEKNIEDFNTSAAEVGEILESSIDDALPSILEEYGIKVDEGNIDFYKNIMEQALSVANKIPTQADFNDATSSFKFQKGQLVASVMNELFGLNSAFMEGRGRKSVVSELFGYGYEQAQLNEQKRLRASGEIEEDEILGLESWEAHLRANLEAKQFDIQNLYDKFVEKHNLPKVSADEYNGLPDTGMMSNFLRFEGRQLDAVDPTPFSRTKTDEAILHWRETGKLPEGFTWGTSASDTIDEVEAAKLMDTAVLTEEKEWMISYASIFEEYENLTNINIDGDITMMDVMSDGFIKQVSQLMGMSLYTDLRKRMRKVKLKNTSALNAYPMYPDAPFVKGGKDFTNLALKRILVQAMDEGKDGIALPSHELLTTIRDINIKNPLLYNKIIPKNLETLIEGTDAKIIDVPAEDYLNNNPRRIGSYRQYGESRNMDEVKDHKFRLLLFTPALKERIKKGFALFSALPLAITGAEMMTNQEGGDNVNTTY
tara:strand:- start:8183 stop:11878 length:3696 start_codon:yes stop_codon:yes gene_type:complete